MNLDKTLEEIQKGIYFSFGYNNDIWADSGYIYEWRFRIVDFNDFLNVDYDINIRGILKRQGQKTLEEIKSLFDNRKGECIFEDLCSYIDEYGRTFIRIYKAKDQEDFLLDVVINNLSKSKEKINYPYFGEELFLIRNKTILPDSIFKMIEMMEEVIGD